MRAETGAVQLRDAIPGEEESMARVLDAAWRAGYVEIIDPAVTAGTSISEWRQTLERPCPEGTRTVVALEPAGAIVGFTRFGPHSTEPDDRDGYIASVYVHPSIAGGGIGRALVEYAVASLAAAGYVTAELWVFRDNVRASSLYERCGFVADGGEMTDCRWGIPQRRYRRLLESSR